MMDSVTLRRSRAVGRGRDGTSGARGPALARTGRPVVALSATAASDAPPRPGAATASEDRAEPAATLAGLRVLVVEDEALVALELEDVLAELGAEVVGMALDADEAVRLAGALRPDCVTMDIRIQGDRDGIAAATEIWALYGIRSVLVSAYGDALTLARAAPANPVALVPKPISKARLGEALARVRS